MLLYRFEPEYCQYPLLGIFSLRYTQSRAGHARPAVLRPGDYEQQQSLWEG